MMWAIVQGLSALWLAILFERWYVQWVRAVTEHDAWGAGFSAAAVVCASAINVRLFVENYWMLLPCVLGHAYGSYSEVKNGAAIRRANGRRSNQAESRTENDDLHNDESRQDVSQG